MIQTVYDCLVLLLLCVPFPCRCCWRRVWTTRSTAGSYWSTAGSCCRTWPGGRRKVGRGPGRQGWRKGDMLTCGTWKDGMLAMRLFTSSLHSAAGRSPQPKKRALRPQAFDHRAAYPCVPYTWQATCMSTATLPARWRGSQALPCRPPPPLTHPATAPQPPPQPQPQPRGAERSHLAPPAATAPPRQRHPAHPP